MKVFVVGLDGTVLMPTKPQKARKLLKEGLAEVYCHRPFTIHLLYQTGTAVQPVTVGVDTGEQHIGIAVVGGNKVIERVDIELRKSMEKRVLMETRKTYRRGRRYRKVRYRHPKFRFHTKRVFDSTKGKWVKVPNEIATNRHEGWLPPSIESKVQHHIEWIQRYASVLPPCNLIIEVAKFDIAHMKDPTIRSEDYQKGRMYEHENVKSYVLAKFNYTCPICKHKFDNEHKARLHHVTYRSCGATNNPDEYAPICELCHTAEAHETTLADLRKLLKHKEYREPTFMNILRQRLFEAFPEASYTYGNFTSADRKILLLPKTHANDAVAIAFRGSDTTIAGGLPDTVYYKQVRKKKRSLYEATPRKGRKEPNWLAKRNKKNTKSVAEFSLFDKVKTKDGDYGYICGFTGRAAYVKSFNGEYISLKGKSHKQQNLSGLKKCVSNNSWLVKTA